MAVISKEVKLVVLDMDGTVYLGDEVFPWTVPFLEKLKGSGKKYVFLTNNSSKGPRDYVEKLRRLKIPVEDDGVYTSGEATAEYIKNNFPKSRVYVLGTDSLKEVFREEGVDITEEDPNVLVLGYDTTVNYEKMKKFALFLRKGIPYIATHPDLNCPSPEGLIPDAGSFIALFKASTGRIPDHIVGKPNPTILEKLMERYGVSKDEVVLIGDRIYTDIKLARNVGVPSILVLSGETKIEDLENSDVEPDFIVKNLSEIEVI